MKKSEYSSFPYCETCMRTIHEDKIELDVDGPKCPYCEGYDIAFLNEEIDDEQ